jgi:uncharacterized membrane protein YgcG
MCGCVEGHFMRQTPQVAPNGLFYRECVHEPHRLDPTIVKIIAALSVICGLLLFVFALYVGLSLRDKKRWRPQFQRALNLMSRRAKGPPVEGAVTVVVTDIEGYSGGRGGGGEEGGGEGGRGGGFRGAGDEEGGRRHRGRHRHRGLLGWCGGGLVGRFGRRRLSPEAHLS